MAAVSAVFAAAVLSAGLAWGCTPEANISVQPEVGTPGSQVTVTALEFVPSQVQFHWGSASGPVVATGQGPNFTTTIQVPPNAAPGVSFIVATARGDGRIWKASAPLEVTSAAGQGAGGQGDGAEGTQSEDEGRRGAGRGDTGSGERNGSRPERPEARAGAGPGSGNATAAGDRSDAAAFSDAIPRKKGPGSEARDDGGAASQRSAASDLWSGFTARRSPLLDSSVGAEPPAEGGQSGPTAILATLLGLGLTTLLAGFLVAARARRARAPAARD